MVPLAAGDDDWEPTATDLAARAAAAATQAVHQPTTTSPMGSHRAQAARAAAADRLLPAARSDGSS
jgi:hypothetical protein